MWHKTHLLIPNLQYGWNGFIFKGNIILFAQYFIPFFFNVAFLRRESKASINTDGR